MKTDKAKKGTLFRMLVVNFTGIFLLACCLLATAFVIYSYSQSKRDYLEYNSMLLGSLENSISSSFDGINNSSRVIIANGRLWDYVMDNYNTEDRFRTEAELESQLRVLLSNMYYYSYHINDVELYLPTQGTLFTINNDVLLGNKPFRRLYSNGSLKEEWVSAATQKKGYQYRSTSNTEGLDISIAVSMPFSDETAFIFKYSLSDSFWEALVSGMSMDDEVVVVLNSTAPIEYCSDSAYQSYLPLLREKISPDAELANMELNLGENHLVAYMGGTDSDWIVVKAIPIRLLFTGFHTSVAVYLLCGLLAVVVMGIVYAALSGKVARPIAELTSSLTAMTPQNLRLDVVYDKDDEIGQLYRECHTIVDMINNLIKKEYEMELGEKEARYKILQLQFNPHFIYNVLQLLSNIAVEENNEEIEEIIGAFGTILRYNMANENKKVRVIEEVSALKHFLFILEKNYGRRLTTSISLENGAEEYSMIPFVLQPIVENALQHGLARKIGPISIAVHITKRDDTLILQVRDNGIGMDAQTLKGLNRQLEKPSIAAPDIVGGKGLSLIRKRIELEYGKEYGVSVESMLNIGTEVTVTLPAVLYVIDMEELD